MVALMALAVPVLPVASMASGRDQARQIDERYHVSTLFGRLVLRTLMDCCQT